MRTWVNHGLVLGTAKWRALLLSPGLYFSVLIHKCKFHNWLRSKVFLMQHYKEDFLYVVKRKKTLNYKLSCIAQETG